MNMPVTLFVLGSGLVLNVAATVPTYDVKPMCRAAFELSGGSGRTVEMCEASEARARSDLVKQWSTFPESVKDQCLRASPRHAPSYVELLVCLELIGENQRRQEPEKPAGSRQPR